MDESWYVSLYYRSYVYGVCVCVNICLGVCFVVVKIEVGLEGLRCFPFLFLMLEFGSLDWMESFSHTHTTHTHTHDNRRKMCVLTCSFDFFFLTLYGIVVLSFLFFPSPPKSSFLNTFLFVINTQPTNAKQPTNQTNNAKQPTYTASTGISLQTTAYFILDTVGTI
jgi:hypothetical protein